MPNTIAFEDQIKKRFNFFTLSHFAGNMATVEKVQTKCLQISL